MPRKTFDDNEKARISRQCAACIAFGGGRRDGMMPQHTSDILNGAKSADNIIGKFSGDGQRNIYDDFNSYFWNDQDCMKNRFNLHNKIELENMVNIAVNARCTDILAGFVMLPGYDADAIKNIHEYLFDDCYDWAGEYRTCDMGRNIQYANADEIAAKIDDFCDRFSEWFLDRKFIDKTLMAESLAIFWAELNTIHPFRDGNGRSQFIFFNNACRYKGYELDFQVKDLRSLRLARDSASENRPQLLVNIIERSLVVYDEEIADMHIGKPEISEFTAESILNAGGRPKKRKLIDKLRYLFGKE